MKILPLIAAVSTLAITASAQQSTTIRYATFMPIGAGLNENPDVDGVAMIRYNKEGWGHVNIVIHGLDADKVYSVSIGDGPTWQKWDVIHPNSRGTGHFNYEFFNASAPLDAVIDIFIPTDMDLGDKVNPGSQRAFAVPL